jgi:polyadenylate-binding protein
VKSTSRVKGAVEFNNLYVKGFDENMTEEKLSSIFAMHGEVTSVSIPDASKGFGYVCYKTHAEALEAINKLNGTN